jgi:hypothetical protein
MPISSSAAVVPAWPVISIGRRGTRPSSQMPTKVASTEITPLAMFAVSALSAAKPASVRIWVP